MHLKASLFEGLDASLEGFSLGHLNWYRKLDRVDDLALAGKTLRLLEPSLGVDAIDGRREQALRHGGYEFAYLSRCNLGRGIVKSSW